MKPEIYYENKNSHIQTVAWNVNHQISSAAKNPTSSHSIDQLRLKTIDFIGLTPDETDAWTDEVWVSNWKAVYNRLGAAIQSLKDQADYRLDTRRRELSAVASALLAARKAVYWIK